jgi:hypothetical protein
MADEIRAAITRDMREQGVNPNQLALLVSGKISRSQVYDFINGASDLGSEKLNHLLSALRLEVRPRE